MKALSSKATGSHGAERLVRSRHIDAETVQLSAVLWLAFAGFAFAVSMVVGRPPTLHQIAGDLANSVSGFLIAIGMIALIQIVGGSKRWRRVAVTTAALVLATLCQTIADRLIALTFLGVTKPIDLTILMMAILIYFFFYTINLALVGISATNRALRTQAARAAMADTQHLRAQLQSLRLKLNPHFMFNALSATSSLVEMDRKDEARNMLDRLAGFLRSSLDVGTEDITLSDELSVLSDYLGVELVRFPDRMDVAMDIDPEAEMALIPSLLLQPLVENAVKYAVAPSLSPVVIEITARRSNDQLVVTVEDRGSTHQGTPVNGLGVGHSVTRSRLALQYGDRADFSAAATEEGFKAEIRLPWSVGKNSS